MSGVRPTAAATAAEPCQPFPVTPHGSHSSLLSAMCPSASTNVWVFPVPRHIPPIPPPSPAPGAFPVPAVSRRHPSRRPHHRKLLFKRYLFYFITVSTSCNASLIPRARQPPPSPPSTLSHVPPSLPLHHHPAVSLSLLLNPPCGPFLFPSAADH